MTFSGLSVNNQGGGGGKGEIEPSLYFGKGWKDHRKARAFTQKLMTGTKRQP